MFEVIVKSHIAAAHYLRGDHGRCANMHGHNWKVHAVVVSEELDDAGMVADFRVLKKDLNDVIDVLDHTCLNDHDYFKTINPTTENLARFVFEAYKSKIAPKRLKRIEVWESDTAGAVYSENKQIES